jgi:hypothetical protein
MSRTALSPLGSILCADLQLGEEPAFLLLLLFLLRFLRPQATLSKQNQEGEGAHDHTFVVCQCLWHDLKAGGLTYEKLPCLTSRPRPPPTAPLRHI